MEAEILHFCPPPLPQPSIASLQEESAPSEEIITDPLPTFPQAINQLIISPSQPAYCVATRIAHIKAELDAIERQQQSNASLPIDTEIQFLQAQIQRIIKCSIAQKNIKQAAPETTKEQSPSIQIEQKSDLKELQPAQLDALYRKLKLIGLECEKARERRQIPAAIEVKINALWERLIGLEAGWNKIPQVHRRLVQLNDAVSNASGVHEQLQSVAKEQQKFNLICSQLAEAVRGMRKEVEDLKASDECQLTNGR